MIVISHLGLRKAVSVDGIIGTLYYFACQWRFGKTIVYKSSDASVFKTISLPNGSTNKFGVFSVTTNYMVVFFELEGRGKIAFLEHVSSGSGIVKI